jgi:hypothetical protein
MKAITRNLPAYNNSVGVFTATGSLRRKVSTCTAAVNLLLPSSKGRRKEFTIVAIGNIVTATVTSPDTIVGTAAVAVGASGTFRALGNKWYRVS